MATSASGPTSRSSWAGGRWGSAARSAPSAWPGWAAGGRGSSRTTPRPTGWSAGSASAGRRSSAWCAACSARTRRSATPTSRSARGSRTAASGASSGRADSGPRPTPRCATRSGREPSGPREGAPTTSARIGGRTGILLAKAFGAVAGVAKGSLALGVTVDRAGDPVELSATAAGTLDGSRGVWRKLRGLTGAGGRSEVDARLDLRDPDNAAAVAGFLAALRRPDRLSELVGTAQALGDRMRDYSDLAGPPLPRRHSAHRRGGAGQGGGRAGRALRTRARERPAGRRLGATARRRVAATARLRPQTGDRLMLRATVRESRRGRRHGAATSTSSRPRCAPTPPTWSPTSRRSR